LLTPPSGLLPAGFSSFLVSFGVVGREGELPLDEPLPLPNGRDGVDVLLDEPLEPLPTLPGKREGLLEPLLLPLPTLPGRREGLLDP
jgi:hypothetical protein